VEFPSIGHKELKGETKHQIVQHVYFGHTATGHFLQDDAALPPLHLVEELPVLVVCDFQGSKGDAQWGMGTLV